MTTVLDVGAAVIPAALTTADCARYAQTAYDDAPTWSVDSRIRACLYTLGDIAVVAVPGTNPMQIEDDLHDLDTDPILVPGLGYVHDGFQKCFVPLYEMIRPALLADASIKRVVITGHSLGGAIAVGLAAQFTRDKELPCSFVTFGSPHVGAGTLRDLLEPTPGHMFWYGLDPVPMLPVFWLWPRPMILFEHPKAQTHIGHPGFPLIEANHLMAHYLSAVPATPV